ncbi:Tfp pilus assembly protein FimT/FimU [Selenomonas sp. F0473]|uniref:pilus assembly FimT family protein n=1 Tax=Selenomonas sp. F0473 TaxID=999423 RepID=UPI00029DFA4B|nr:prepilin-type N-terminal cleavage/methylation domain-containing protein [Selenomonas sp. F0473]EKU70485.1 prepilin-type N-terminal cleavage/methylation domain-containing protein [Selenomonas sp. F0473]
MRRAMRGMALLEMLVGLSVAAVILSAALPIGISIYARAAVTYEAAYLVSELRRVQAVSRTTAMPLYVLEQHRAGTRNPSLHICADGYDIRHPVEGIARRHDLLPLIRLHRHNLTNRPAAFGGNGDVAWSQSANMTIRIYARGHEEDFVSVVIDRAARIRIERGAL